ncbi:MAG: hypothetical protein NZ789_07470 [Pseudomonadales bacterium]|nr:hypothetical protein [Pseudomonadales bacterium]
MKRWTWKYGVWILLYVGMIATIVLLLLRVQQQVQNDTLNPETQQHWDQWVETAREQASGAGPVQRRAPQSKDPPLSVLMDQYFLVCVVTSCVLATALFLTLVFMIQGSYNAGRSVIGQASEKLEHEQ